VVATLEHIKEEQQPTSGDAYVFPPTGRSGRVSRLGHRTTIHNAFKKIVAEAGVREDTRPYDFRKAFATTLVAAGGDMRTVMSLTGHTQVSVLMKYYAQPVPEKQREALKEVLRRIA
jgi:site-specific recombinase XerD